ncbi:MAG: nuclear transport factor 2 family protein [Firmicutes bacterium]|nr:nuclear transport factor 2 family protein [Bacillota bacterium]
MHVYGIFLTPFNKPWTETEPMLLDGSRVFPDEWKPDKAPTNAWEYRTTSIYPGDQPKLPEPYKSFVEKDSY